MATERVSLGPLHKRPSRRIEIREALVCVVLSALAALLTGCSNVIAVGAPPVTEQWTPPYLELFLYAGKAQVQWTDESEWITLEGKASITIAEHGRIVADEGAGAEFYLGDGSTLELSPGTIIELRNPRTIPRLQMVVHSGSLQFFAQKPSYEFDISGYPMALLSVPALIRIEADGDTTLLAVEEGAVTCEMEGKALMLPKCRDMRVVPGEEPSVTEFCTVSTLVAPPTSTPRPGSTSPGAELDATPSQALTSTATTLTPTPTTTRAGIVLTPASTAVRPTDTPEPPKPEKPKATEPPPPPTDPPPPPTDPPPPPTDPPPPPTDPPPEPTQPRPTPPPGDEPDDTPEPGTEEPPDTPEPQPEEPPDTPESQPEEPRDTPEPSPGG